MFSYVHRQFLSALFVSAQFSSLRFTKNPDFDTRYLACSCSQYLNCSVAYALLTLASRSFHLYLEEIIYISYTFTLISCLTNFKRLGLMDHMASYYAEVVSLASLVAQ